MSETLKKCNRCGSLVVCRFHIHLQGFLPDGGVFHEPGYFYGGYICNDCKDEFKRWWDMKKSRLNNRGKVICGNGHEQEFDIQTGDMLPCKRCKGEFKEWVIYEV